MEHKDTVMLTLLLNEPYSKHYDFSVTDAESLYDTTANMAQQALRKAEEAYDDSLDIFSTAESIVLPSINVDTMKEDAQDIKEEVNTIM